MTKVSVGPGISLNNEEVDQLLHPARFHARPADVAADERLTIDERRAVLSSWASDACAVESNPALRRPPSAQSAVTFDEIMDALLQLDRIQIAAATAAAAEKPGRRRRDSNISNRARSREALSTAV
jgi:hypothetical protein